VTVHPDVIRLAGAPASGPLTTAQCEKADGIACFEPGQLRSAYHLPALYAKGVTGQGATIMIVDSFGSPTIRADLTVFDRQFGYPAPPAFGIIAPAGKIPAFNPGDANMTSWAAETTLDVEYAHALAPGAKLLLVETPVAETEGVTGFPQIVRAEEYALAHYRVGVVSQSFGATEETYPSYAQLAPLRAAYVDASRRHVTVVSASGDAGATDYEASQDAYYPRRVTSWPDSDPLVTAVGGTQLRPTRTGYTSVAWNDTEDQAWLRYADGSPSDPEPAASGGGTSAFFARPAYQNTVAGVTGARRGVPDIAMSAACDGAVNVYSSFLPLAAGWSLTCGTSEAAPEFAAVVALADQVAGHPLGPVNPTLYADQVREARRVDVLGRRVEFGQRPPAVAHDAVRGVHGGDVPQRPLLVGNPADEVVVVLQAERRRPVHVRYLHVGVDQHLVGRHGHVRPAGLLEQLPAGGGVEVLARLDPAARGTPVLPLGRQVVIEEQQHPPRRVDRDHPPRQPLRQLRLSHRTIVPCPIVWRACWNV
jgi:subtilase family serine protease